MLATGLLHSFLLFECLKKSFGAVLFPLFFQPPIFRMETGLGKGIERKINRGKSGCDYCSKIALKDRFQTPNEYKKTVAYIKELLDIQHFVLIEGSCELGRHKNVNGHWMISFIIS